MKGRLFTIFIGGFSLVIMLSAPAFSQTRRIPLQGFLEVPAISTTGTGACKLRIDRDPTDPSIIVELTYENLESNVTQAHIHLAQPDVNGGIVLFLCSNLGNGPAGTQPCPGTTSGSITVILTAANVIPVAAQGIGAGEMGEIIQAIRRRAAYCNVHTELFPGGEVRGNLR